MKFLRYRSEQLAELIREQVLRGELTEPLPGTREWSQQLGVGRMTLLQALAALKRERLIRSTRTGFRLDAGARAKSSLSLRTVKILYHARDSLDVRGDYDWIQWLSERLHREGIQLVVEKCSGDRLQKIVGQSKHANELFLLFSVPVPWQFRFAEAGVPSIVLGQPAAGEPLPFVQVDQDSAVRHATQTLLRRGFSRLDLVLPKLRAAGVDRSRSAFEAACASWPHQPVQRETILIPLALDSQVDAVGRFTARLKGRHGIVLISPVRVGMIMTALLARGVAVPADAEIIAVFPEPDSIHVYPPPAHYPYPQARIARVIMDAAMVYFETGKLPRLRKTLGAEMVAGQPLPR